jgi:predicted DsbA family dithiol-disulfide isomerase
MQVDVWSDVVCPWCYLGKARLEKALAAFDGRDEVTLTYRSFELDPGWPEELVLPVANVLSAKYGMSEDQARSADGRVAGLAEAEGLDFNSGRPYGNTFNVHRVLHAGRDAGIGRQLLTAVNKAYFGEGLPVFDAGVLTDVAAGAGMDPGVVAAVLGGDEYADAVRTEESAAQDLGVTGVPFFVFDRRLAVSGAQPVETLAEVLRQASDESADGS